MHRIILLRHAKSDWPAGIKDHDRPLAERGQAAAPLMGRYLAREHIIPDLALISSARRTQETWSLVAPEFSEAVTADIQPRIYNAGTQMLLDIVRDIADDIRTVMIVGHNPGMQEFAMQLTGHGDRYAYARLQGKYPTCGMAIIDFHGEDWRDVVVRNGRLDRFITPAMLGGTEDD
ncbi:MAG: SixA phosphatase family protein [Beijerinckiaceae bacterium]